jgi:hypothetical protein
MKPSAKYEKGNTNHIIACSPNKMKWALLKCFFAGIHTIVDETLFLGLEIKEKAQSMYNKKETRD